MMAVTVERALAFPLRDSCVPCKKIKHEEEKGLWDPHHEAAHTPGSNFHVFDPAVDGKNEPRHGLQPNYGKSGIAKQSQGISQQIFPLGLCDAAGPKQSHGNKAMVKTRTAARGVAALPFSAWLQRCWKTKLKRKNPGKTSPLWERGSSPWVREAAGARVARCGSYQICRNRRGDESVGPVNQRAADDQHRCGEPEAGGGTGERFKSLSAGSGRTPGPSPSAHARASLSCTSVFVFPRIPPSEGSSLPQIWDWEPGSGGEIKGGDGSRLHRGAPYLSTCRCRSGRRDYTGTAAKETQGQPVVAIPAVFPSVFLAVGRWRPKLQPAPSSADTSARRLKRRAPARTGSRARP